MEPIRLEINFNANNRAVVREVNASLADTQARLERLAQSSRNSTVAMRALNAELNRASFARQMELTTHITRAEQAFTRLASVASSFARISFYAAITQVAAMSYALKELGQQFLKVNEQFASLQITMKSSFGSAAAARGMREELVKITASSPIPFQGLAELMRSASVIPYTRGELLRQSTTTQGYGDPNGMMRRLVGVAEKMVTFRPDKTIQDAIFALREALSGQFRSIIRRFDVPSSSFSAAVGRPMSELQADPALTFKAIEVFFGNIITPQAVQELIRQPRMLWQNLLEQIIDIPLLRVGDQGFYKKFLQGFSGIYEEATRFMESGAFTKYAVRISDALGNAFDKISNVGGSLFDRILSSAGQGRSDRPGVGVVDRAAAAITKATEYLSTNLPPILDRIGGIISGLAPIFTKLITGVFKLVELFSSALSAHPVATLGGLGAAYALAPGLMNFAKDRMVRGATGAYAASIAGSVPAMTGSGTKYWDDYNAGMYANIDREAAEAAPFLMINSKGKQVLDAKYKGPLSMPGKRNFQQTPVTSGYAAMLKEEEAKYNAANAIRMAEYEKELAVPAAGATLARTSRLGGFMNGVGSRAMAGGSAVAAGAVGLGQALIPIAAAAALFYGSVQVYELATNSLSKAADRMLSGVKGNGLNAFSTSQLSGQVNQDYAAFAKAKEMELSLRKVNGDTEPFNANPSIETSYLMAATERANSGSIATPGGSINTGDYDRASVGLMVGHKMPLDKYVKDTESLVAFQAKLAALIDPNSPNHVQSIPAGSYSNDIFKSPKLDSDNVGLIQKFVDLTRTILNERSSNNAEGGLTSVLSSQFKYAKPNFSSYVSEDAQKSIMNMAVNNNEFTQRDLMLASPQWSRLANLPALTGSAESSSYALQNFLSDKQATMEKSVPEAASLEQVKQLSLWNTDITSLSQALTKLSSSSEGLGAQREWAKEARATVDLQRQQIIAQNGGSADLASNALNLYSKQTGDQMLKLAGMAETGTLDQSIITESRQRLQAVSVEMFGAYATLVGDSLSNLVSEAYSGKTVQDYDSKRPHVLKLFAALDKATGGRYGNLSDQEANIRGMYTDPNIQGPAATTALLNSLSARDKFNRFAYDSTGKAAAATQADILPLAYNRFSPTKLDNYRPSSVMEGGNNQDSLVRMTNDLDHLLNTQRALGIEMVKNDTSYTKVLTDISVEFNKLKGQESSRGVSSLSNVKDYGPSGIGTYATSQGVADIQSSFSRLYPAIKLSADEMQKFDILRVDSTDAKDVGNLIAKYQTLSPLLADISKRMADYVNGLQKEADLMPEGKAKQIAQANAQAAYMTYKPAALEFSSMSNNMSKRSSDVTGDGLTESFSKGFLGVTEEWKQTAFNMESIGKGLADNLSSNFTSAWDGFISGSESGGKAFQKFATSMLSSMSSMLANKAFTAIFGYIVGAAFTSVPASTAAGVSSSIAAGPVAYTPGAYATGGLISGGSGVRDDVPIMAMGGEGVLNKRAMAIIGNHGLNMLNNGNIRGYADGGAVGRVPTGLGIGGVSTNHVSITVNTGNNSVSSSSKSSNSSQDQRKQTDEFARNIKAAVLNVMDEQQRIGGRLRR